MFRKTSIIGLLAALLVLVGIFYTLKYTGSEDRTFRAQVLEYEPDAITALHITDYQTGIKTELHKTGESWTLTENGVKYKGGVDAIVNVINLLNKLNTESIVATNSDKWEKYDVDEQKAIRVKLYAENDLAGDVFIGKFTFEQIPPSSPGMQPQTIMTSFVRPADDDKVYAVNGILRSNFQDVAKGFRDRNVFSCNDHYDITSLKISGPDMQLEVLQTDTATWTVNGMLADSANTERFMRSLSRLKNFNFIDGVDVSTLQPEYTAVIEGKTFSPVTINAYPAADTTIKYYITSTFNEGTVFDGMKSKTFEKVFGRIDKFMAE